MKYAATHENDFTAHGYFETILGRAGPLPAGSVTADSPMATAFTLRYA
jgi:hypothetical protein